MYIDRGIEPRGTSIGGTEPGGTLIGGTKPPTTLVQTIHCKPNRSQGLVPNSYKYQGSYQVENILTNFTLGITSRSGLKNMCAFKDFISVIKPRKVNKALFDANWIIAIQEELNQFEIRKV